MENEVFQITGLSERMKTLRKRSGLTQEQVAERMGITCKSARSVISVLENTPTANPTLRVMCAYLRAVGAHWADVTDLLERLEPLPDMSPGLIAGAKEVLPVEQPRQYLPAGEPKAQAASPSQELKPDDSKYQIADSEY